MRKPASVNALTDLGRVRLSRSFFMRDFLYTEIGNLHGVPNIPDDPDLAVAAGRGLCEHLLEPLQDTFGRIAVRSAYRSSDLNQFGWAKQKDGAAGYNCASNESNYAGHIWDKLDSNGRMGATACIVVPWLADQYDVGRDWRDLAWWIHDHLPYSEMYFFPKLAAFNLAWSEVPVREISSYVPPKGKLLAAGVEPEESSQERQARYADFPPLRGNASPEIPPQWRNITDG